MIATPWGKYAKLSGYAESLKQYVGDAAKDTSITADLGGLHSYCTALVESISKYRNCNNSTSKLQHYTAINKANTSINKTLTGIEKSHGKDKPQWLARIREKYNSVFDEISARREDFIKGTNNTAQRA